MAETRGSLPKMTVSEPTANPVPVVIYCPACQSLHIDEGEWATRPHKTHQCQKCKLEWRPFPYATVGVASRKHYHKAMYDDLSGVLLEDCAICGESWRSTDVHISNPSVAEPKTLAANCSQIARAEPSRGAPSWSKMMAEMQPCGHTNAQHLYHDSGDIKIDLSACLVHTSIEHAGQTSGGTTADVAKTASAAPDASRGAPDARQKGASQGALRAAIALRKELAESSIGSWFADGQGINDERNALVQWAAELIDRETGHVVLLEALRNTTQTLRLMLAGNPTYPADARAEVRKEIAEAEAAIKQAERT